jgi:hypothetical protein
MNAEDEQAFEVLELLVAEAKANSEIKELLQKILIVLKEIRENQPHRGAAY